MNVLLVRRSPRFSPHSTEADSAILDSVGRNLEQMGFVVTVTDEDSLAAGSVPDGMDAVLHMTRSEEALERIDISGVPAVNGTASVRACVRGTLVRRLEGSGLIPESMVCRTAHGVPAGWHSWPCWVKRADSQASLGTGDVSLAGNADECAGILQTFGNRGIGECVLQKHMSGRTVKFYAVKGAGIVGMDSEGTDIGLIGDIAERAAALLGLEVFGGDAVICNDGSAVAVDINDWPSFGVCREKAALAIARLVSDKLRVL